MQILLALEFAGENIAVVQFAQVLALTEPLLGLADHEANVLRTPRDLLRYGLDEGEVAVDAEGVQGARERADGPFAEGVLLAAQLVAQAERAHALGAQLRQARVQELAVRAELRVGRVAQAEHAVAHVLQRARVVEDGVLSGQLGGGRRILWIQFVLLLHFVQVLFKLLLAKRKRPHFTELKLIMWMLTLLYCEIKLKLVTCFSDKFW